MSNEVTVTPPEAPADSAPPPTPPPNGVWQPAPRRWLSLRNLFSVLLLAALIVLAYFIWQGRGAFVAVERNEEPFKSDGELVSPQEFANNTIILEEQFTNPKGTWSFSPPNQADFFGEGLFLEDNIYTGEAWARPGLLFEDFVLNVDTRWLGGSLSGDYGLRIRKNQDTGEYLALYLHNDGRYTISQQTRRTLTVHANQYSSAIKVNGEVNNIQIEALDDQIHFFVNGSYLGTFNATLPADGEIEFVATKGDGSDLYMAGFDNLTITHNFVGQNSDG